MRGRVRCTLQIDGEKDVVGRQAAWSPHFGREEVYSGDLAPMGLQKSLPGGRTVRCWLIPWSFNTLAIVLGATRCPSCLKSPWILQYPQPEFS